MEKQGTWLEQYERVQRYYDIFKRINDELPPTIDKAHEINLFDQVIAFFVFCFHLKDWIYHDKEVKFPDKGAVLGKFIKDNDCIKLCEAICTSVKHLNLKTKSLRAIDYKGFKNKAKISRHIKDGKMVGIRAKFYILIGSEEKDAFELATECLKTWEKFIEQNIEKDKV